MMRLSRLLAACLCFYFPSVPLEAALSEWADTASLQSSRSTVLPRLTTQMRYPAVRAALIRAGWQPVPLAPRNSCGWDQCPPFPEVLQCGASESWCHYAWRRGPQWLILTAGGEDLEGGQWFERTRTCRSIDVVRSGPQGRWTEYKCR